MYQDVFSQLYTYKITKYRGYKNPYKSFSKVIHSSVYTIYYIIDTVYTYFEDKYIYI